MTQRISSWTVTFAFVLFSSAFMADAAIPDPSDAPSCTIEKYGAARLSGEFTRRTAPETTSGGVRLYGRIEITEHTREIKATKGAAIGLAHLFRNIPLSEELDLVVTHPPMRRSDGTMSTGFTTKWSPDHEFTIYGLDHDYEIVKGEWRFQYRFRGVVLCAQEFRTY